MIDELAALGLAFAATLGLGHVFCRSSSDIFHKRGLFVRLAMGNYALSALTACFFTEGKTLFWGSLPLYLAYRFGFEQRSGEERAAPATPRFWILLGLSLWAIFFAQWLILSSDSCRGLGLTGDDYVYTRYIERLKAEGVERAFLDGGIDATAHPTPYHYGDLWHAVAMQMVSGADSLSSMMLISRPLLALIAVLGVVILIEDGYPSRSLTWLFALSILFWSGISWYVPAQGLWTRGDWYNISINQIGKCWILGAGVVSLCMAYRTGALAWFALVACGLGIAYLPMIVPLGGACLLLALYRMRAGLRFQSQDVPVLGAVLLSAVWVVFFYAGSGGSDARLNGPGFGRYYLTLEGSLRILKVTVGIGFKVLVSLLPILLALWVGGALPLWRRAFSRALPPLGAILLACVLSYGLLHRMVDSVQFWSLLYIAVCAIVGSLALAGLWYGPRRSRGRLVAILLLTLVAVQRWLQVSGGPPRDLSFCRSVLGETGGDDLDGSLVYLRPSQAFADFYMRNVSLYIPYPELASFRPYYRPICISAEEMPPLADPFLQSVATRIVEGTEFHRFGQFRREHRGELSSDQLQALFVRERRIQWALVSPDVLLGEELRRYFDSSSPRAVSQQGWKLLKASSGRKSATP